MTGRIGDIITDPTLARCEGCCQSLIMCQVTWTEDTAPCCGVCTHIHVSPEPYMVER